jgi:NAD(P) transhydrogenase subunit alpha
MVDKATKQLSINRDDELVKATMLTDGGKVVHPNFAGKEAATAASKPIVPGQNRGDDPEVGKAAKGTEPGLDVAPKKAVAKKPARAKPVTPGQNRGDDAATEPAAKKSARKPAAKKPVVPGRNRGDA